MLIVHHLPKKNSTEKSVNLDIKKRWTSVKGKFPPIIRKKFLPDSKLHRDINPKVNYEAQKEHETLKREHLSRMKDELEFQNCTFQPDFNMTSITSATQSERIPIQSRGCPDRYNQSYIENQMTIRAQTLQESELATLKIKSSEGKTPDPNFYEEKVKWKKDIEEKCKAKADELFEKHCSTFIGKPEVLDYSKNKIVNPEALDQGPFLERVEKDIVKRKDNVIQLEKKYYSYPYKPTLHQPRKRELEK